MPVPKQVEEQGKAADKLLEDYAGKTKPDEDLKLVPAPDDDKSPQADDKSTPDDKKPTDQDKPPAEPAKEDFEQKYKVLKGKYDAEVPQLQNEVRNLSYKIQGLVEAAAEVPKEGPKADPEPAKKPDVSIEAKDFLPQDAIERFEEAGYDAQDLNVLAQLAHSIAKGMVAPVQTDMRKINKNLVVSEKDKFWSSLDDKVPDLKEIEGEEDFKGFILTKAPYLKGTRQQVLEAAAKRLDIDTVIEIYDDYRKIRKKPSATPAQPKDLGGQIEPGSGSGAEPGPAKGRLYTSAEVDKFYKDWANGGYNHDPEGAEKLDKDISLANAEGRIKP